MPSFIDETGKVYGRWTVIERGENSRSGKILWLCRCECGVERTVYGASLRKGVSTGCGCRECSYRWKGGRYTNRGGYVELCDREHPNARLNGQILEHVKVMSEHLGRPLRPKETVHHKNGVRDDNRIENLELWSSRHPKGQRIEDQVDHAVEILELYSPEKLCQT